ncbi:ShlB/FhaC/HecB family hemolysin secretion/activation protein [Undibacterium sp. TS12]|uniref:ShlB/FhaC/HecB family hemolysin secretion/activation protein n=1 Tax=Undibacterium sp. TS12 TaxID=2908202 RepID=UPI001F4C5BE5|nr:ShlB/FhaC/HecB family hemolysin secretion/activation protein [Undibacterium sp. TS12]MCH8619296.1 BamA/TamA family outer membrane protein [Undibacterium sp. TS12]
MRSLKSKYSRPCFTVSLLLALTCGFGQPVSAQDTDSVIGRFEVSRYDVKGNDLLPATVINELLTPYTGKNRSFADVQKALETLEKAYHQKGYGLVQVVLPEQELNQGVVKFVVVQARIGSISVKGNKNFDSDNVRRSLPQLREGDTPNIKVLSNSLKLANENPAKKTNLQFETASKEGEVNAVLNVVDNKPWAVGANLDNAGDSNTGKSHLGLLFQHANISGNDDVLSLQYTTTLQKPSKYSVLGVGYHLPVYARGDSVDVYASYSNVDSGSVAAGIFDLAVSGRGSVFGTRYNYSLGRSEDFDSRLSLGLDYKAFKNNVALQGIQLGNDVTVHPLSLTYSGNVSSTTGETSFYLTAVHNIPGGEKGKTEDFLKVRSGAKAGYSILRYGAGYSRVLPAAWQLKLTLSGQYTSDSLVPGEQFGAGGASSVRGFTERALANDYGTLFSGEIYTPNLCAGFTSSFTQCQLLGFYDMAHVSRNKALPGEQASASIASVGIGFRLAMSRMMSLQMDYGKGLRSPDELSKDDRRLHVRLGVNY